VGFFVSGIVVSTGSRPIHVDPQGILNPFPPAAARFQT
jgi:hypothetical protein